MPSLVAANNAYMVHLEGLPIAPGIDYGDVVRLITASGRMELGEFAPDQVAARMVARLDADTIEPMTVQMKNGSWFRLTNRRGRRQGPP